MNWDAFIMTFVPLFVVIDALGTSPFVISASQKLPRKEQTRLTNMAVFTAAVIGLVFLFLGQFLLNLMGISVGSFAIAGGIILVILAVKHMTTGQMVDVRLEEMVAVVPIGTPLTVGPATIATLLLLVTQYSVYMVLLSFSLNMLITWVIFITSNRISAFLGQGGIRAFSRVFSLILAAIGVNMVIRGLGLVGILNIKV
jgi:multiple antibiotic resistance protein